MANWHVYIIETKCLKLYTGITTNLERRLAEHSAVKSGGKKGAKFFRAHEVGRIVWSETRATRSDASKREAEIKAMSRVKKQQLLASLRVPRE